MPHSEMLVTRVREDRRGSPPRLIWSAVIPPFPLQSGKSVRNMPHFVFVNSKGLAEKCIGASLAAVTDPQNGIRRDCGKCIALDRAGCWKPNTEAVTSIFLSLVGSDQVDIARAFCTLLTYERILRISTNFHAGDRADRRKNIFWRVRNVTRISTHLCHYFPYEPRTCICNNTL